MLQILTRHLVLERFLLACVLGKGVWFRQGFRVWHLGSSPALSPTTFVTWQRSLSKHQGMHRQSEGWWDDTCKFLSGVSSAWKMLHKELFLLHWIPVSTLQHLDWDPGHCSLRVDGSQQFSVLHCYFILTSTFVLEGGFLAGLHTFLVTRAKDNSCWLCSCRGFISLSKSRELFWGHVIVLHAFLICFPQSSGPMRHLHVGPSVESFRHMLLLFYIFFPTSLFPESSDSTAVLMKFFHFVFWYLWIWMCPPKAEKFYKAQVAWLSLVTFYPLFFIGPPCPAGFLLHLLYKNSASISPHFLFLSNIIFHD